ncbi:MAG TPA: hypothetical protein VEV16_04465 [Daejeonella sp.]|nr:hypothetical protein [Daejeonella sp.]
MSNRSKKIFLAISIIAPFLMYCFYYYSIMVKNAPYKFAEFESITFKYGIGDSLVNQYNSKTGDYQYLNNADSLIKTKVKLSKDDLLYLHRKAAEQGFWNFPENMSGKANPGHDANAPRYYIEYDYQHKSKHVLFDADYNGNPKLGEAARNLIKEINSMVEDAHSRQRQ